MLKRVVSLVVGVACLMSMTSAFAVMTYDATTTEYFSEDQIKVTSTVTGDSGDVATYLVYDETLRDATKVVQGSDIIYVDQYKFTEAGSYEFAFVTDSANVGSKIQVGNRATSLEDAPAKVPNISYPVTVTTGGSSAQEIRALTDDAEDAWVKVPYNAIDASITEVTFNGSTLSEEYWFVSVNALWIGEQDWSTESNTIDVTVEETAASSATTISMAYFAAAEAGEGYTEPSVVAVGQVVGNSTRFGIILGESTQAIQSCLDAMNADEEYAENTPYKAEDVNAAALPSLGKNSEGKFAIRVYDSGLAGDMYAATYFFDGEEYQLSDNYTTISINE